MKRIIFLVLLFLLVSVPGLSQDDLQKMLASAGDAKDFPNAPYLVAFDRTTVRVEESGLSHVDKVVLYKVLNSEGAKSLQSLTFGYDPLSAYVEVREMKIVRAAGAMETVPLSAVKDYPAPAWGIYWGAREIIIPAGRLESGDGIWIKTYQKGFTYALLGAVADDRYIPPMKGHFYDIVPFYSTVPVRVKSYQVSMPSARRPGLVFLGGERHSAFQGRGRHGRPFRCRTQIAAVDIPGLAGQVTVVLQSERRLRFF
jgi:hypothetical protein